MRITIDYDKSGLEIEIPDENLVGVLNLNPAPVLEDPIAAVRDSLAHPIGSALLRELCRGRKTACVVVSDITRPVPNRVILPPLLEELERGGIKRGNILILIATGIHRPNEGRELIEMLGEEIVRDYRVVNHDARDETSHVNVGTTPRGVPVEVDGRYVESDLKVLTGLVEPHLMAGYSGGRKSVLPGISSLRSVRVWHSPRFLEEEKATAGVLSGNPVHEEAVAAARLAGVDFILNVALNDEREVIGVFAGELEAAFEEAVKLVDEVAKVEIAEPVEIVITSGGGYPLDTTYYQTIKGYVGALPAVRRGGVIIAAAGLAEGIGSAEFEKLVGDFSSLDDFMREIARDDFFVTDQWQLEEMAKAARHAECWLFSDGLPIERQEGLFVKPLTSVEDGIRMALEKWGGDARIIAVPKGPYVIPVVSGENR